MAKSTRIMLIIAACYDYEIWQMDVKKTFLNNFVEEEISIDQLEDFTSLREKRRSVISKCPYMVSKKLLEAGISILMRSYGVLISSRMILTLVYTTRSVGAQLHSSCFTWTNLAHWK
ncbi:UNVERIFIED_CONTAM: hypothetical protein Sangu_3098700 [Sesamum angustifolium]|uniref:Reverse transcriptase Ty1/copia-type domain-containing protein n=1 Tax=Sesamum angustifolium TaxID=2727405 RepID=A0AAW2K9I7_9LAMI